MALWFYTYHRAGIYALIREVVKLCCMRQSPSLFNRQRDIHSPCAGLRYHLTTDLVVSLNIRGPQYRPQNTRILIIGIHKKVTLIFSFMESLEVAFPFLDAHACSCLV